MIELVKQISTLEYEANYDKYDKTQQFYGFTDYF